MMKPLKYLILLVLPAIVVAGFFLGGWFNYLILVCSLFAYPVVNFFMSFSEKQADSPLLQTTSAYKNIALAFVPVLTVLTAWCVYKAGTTKMDTIAFSGFAVSLGCVNGILGFTLAHEFIHRFTNTERIAGYILLLQNNYMHYGIEHLHGHHVYACTPEDPHTARLGESIYRFLPRAIFHTYTNALAIERKRMLKKKYSRPLLHNRIFWFGILQLALMVTIFFTLNSTALLFFMLQNSIAILLLHIINYIQHYGLMRKINTKGKYEKLAAHHAWHTGSKNSSLNLFQLENHADHHLHPHKSYQQLSATDGSPEHPAGYSFMVLLSLVPPLWFKIMNKKIQLNF